MIRKSVLSVLLAMALASPLIGPLGALPAAAATRTTTAEVVDAPNSPTLFKTGDRRVLVMWGDGAAGASYEVSIAGGSTRRSTTTDSTSAAFTNLPLNHRYVASVVAIDAAGERSQPALTNTVVLGVAPSGEPEPSTGATATPSQQPSSSPTPGASTPPTSSPSSTPSQTPSAQPSASPTPPSGSSGADQPLLAQVQPAQWAIGGAVALLTFGALMLLRRRVRGARR